MRVLISLLTCVLATASAFSQFGIGKLKRALDTAQKVSEMSISEEDEIALGERVSANIRNHFGVLQDEKVTRYVTLVGLVLAQHGSRPDLEYHFIVLDSGAINAFAAPGGYIHITRGALAAIQDEAELAGVLGHEIAHVTERHTLEGIKKAKGLEIAQGETLRGSPAVMDKLADNMSQAILAGFGRKEELESDEVGVELASAAGYDPGGLVRFLETLKAANAGSSSKAGLFASHPETDERLKKLDKQIEKDNLAAKATVRLPERYRSWISIASAQSTVEGAGTDQAKGLAGSDGKKEGEGKGKGGFLGKLSNPTGSGEKQQRAEVTGTGAGRGVGAETEEKNAAPVKTDEKAEERQEKKGGFLGKLSNPFGSGEKQDRAEVTGTGAGRGVGAETEEKNAAPVKTDEKAEEKQEKKGGFLGKLSNPFGSGEKQDRAEVTGTGAGRGVGSEGQPEAGPVKTAAAVVVKVTPKELAAFKKEGDLR